MKRDMLLDKEVSCEATAWGVAHASRNPNAKWEHLTAGGSASFDHVVTWKKVNAVVTVTFAIFAIFVR